MDQHTLVTVSVVVLVAAAAFVTARLGAVAIGSITPGTGLDEASAGTNDVDDSGSDPGADSLESIDCDGSERGDRRITAADRERIRRYLEKDRVQRCPDDLRPSDDEGS
jgi:hypothetical protein